jgi:hypothetical protein
MSIFFDKQNLAKGMAHYSTNQISQQEIKEFDIYSRIQIVRFEAAD